MGLLRGMARTAVVAGTATAVSNNVSRRQARKWAQDEDPAQVEEPEFVATDEDVADQLHKFAGLRDKGILTQEEFDAKKKQLLGI